MRILCLLLVFIAIPLTLMGCEGIEQSVQKASEDPSQIPVAFASVAGGICILLFFFRDSSIAYDILDAIIITSLGLVVMSPFFYMGSEPEQTYMMAAAGGAGVIGGVLIRLAYSFSRYLGAKTRAANRANRPPSEEDD